MTGYMVVCDYDYIDAFGKRYVYDNEEMARQKAIELIKEVAICNGDNDAYDNPEKALGEENAYVDINGTIQVSILDCEIFLKAEQDKEQRIREVFDNVNAKDWPDDIIKHLDVEYRERIWGPVRVAEGTDKKAVVKKEYQDFTNNELLTYILTGEF